PAPPGWTSAAMCAPHRSSPPTVPVRSASRAGPPTPVPPRGFPAGPPATGRRGVPPRSGTHVPGRRPLVRSPCLPRPQGERVGGFFLARAFPVGKVRQGPCDTECTVDPPGTDLAEVHGSAQDPQGSGFHRKVATQTCAGDRCVGAPRGARKAFCDAFTGSQHTFGHHHGGFGEGPVGEQ